MGNLNTDGIINPGTEVILLCKDCNNEFAGKTGVITIKGNVPTPEYCSECNQKHLESYVKTSDLFK
jgi:hypothetical protein